MKRSLLMAAFIMVVPVSSAHAYVDPGTGSLLLQVLLGGAAGLLVAAKLFWHRITALFGRRATEAKRDS